MLSFKCYYPTKADYIFSAFVVFIASIANADPFLTYVYVKNVEGKLVPSYVANDLENTLHQQGFVYPSQTLKPLNFRFSPTISFDNNANGGNPQKPLKIGNLIFEGDPQRAKRSDLMVGMSLGANLRASTGWGKYIDLNANYDFAHALNSYDKATNKAVSICIVNHYKDWNYLNFCWSNSELNKTFQNTNEDNKSVTYSKFFTLSDDLFAETKGSVNFLTTNTYNQKIYTASVRAKYKGTTFDVSKSVGEKPDENNTHALNKSISVRATFPFLNKEFSLRLNTAEYLGSTLFGVSRRDVATNVSFAYPFSRNVIASLGYQKNESSLDYYTDEYPTLKFTFVD